MVTSDFHRLFSGHAAVYAEFRPRDRATRRAARDGRLWSRPSIGR